jgi:transcriptional regulator with XRE-family HTH domain
MDKLVVRRDRLAERMRLSGIATDDELARLMRVHPTQLSRVITGKSAPGNKFIAAMLRVFGVGAFQDLFELADDDPDDGEAVSA